MVKTVPQIIDQIEADKDKMEFMSTGWKSVDYTLDGGFLRKELIIIGAATGAGKSYIAGQLMYNIAKQGFRCAYFSLEISNEMVVSRMMGALANLKPTRIRLGFLDQAEFQRKIQAKADLHVLNDLLFFYDDMYLLDQILAELREKKYDFVIIDFVQNVMVPGTEEYARLSSVALQLQQVAKEMDGTILALSQLSNMSTREGTNSKVIEYKGSGSIATVADLAFLIAREEKKEDPVMRYLSVEDSTLQMILRKNRRGVAGQIFRLKFRAPGGLIYE